MKIHIRCPHCGTWIQVLLDLMIEGKEWTLQCHFCKWMTLIMLQEREQ